jgi:uncharacterized membrane protein YraQ (UPF0718 family)
MSPTSRGKKGAKWALPLASLAAAAGLGMAGRLFPGFAYGRKAGDDLVRFLLEMASVLPAMFLLVGLFEVWVPRAVIERYAGRRSGAAAVPWMILLATLQAGPLYGAYPVAVSLWKKGCAPWNVFIYLGMFSALKIPLLTFEVSFLGWEFSLARTAVTIPVFTGLGIILAKLLPRDYIPPAVLSGNQER